MRRIRLFTLGIALLAILALASVAFAIVTAFTIDPTAILFPGTGLSTSMTVSGSVACAGGGMPGMGETVLSLNVEASQGSGMSQTRGVGSLPGAFTCWSSSVPWTVTVEAFTGQWHRGPADVEATVVLCADGWFDPYMGICYGTIVSQTTARQVFVER